MRTTVLNAQSDGTVTWKSDSSFRSRLSASCTEPCRAIVGLVASLIADTGSNRRLTAAAVSFAALLVALGTGVLGMHHAMNRRRTLEDHAVDVLAEKIRTAMSETHATRPLFHIEPPIWTIAAGALLQIRKNGAAFAVDPRWNVMFGEAFEPDGREDARLTLAGSIRLPIVTKTP